MKANVEKKAHFSIGELVHHRLFDYRGVIFDVDAEFSGEEEWYDLVAKTRPSKSQPWYHVMVDGQMMTTYVAQQNLEPDLKGGEINHPAIDSLFDSFEHGAYHLKEKMN